MLGVGYNFATQYSEKDSVHISSWWSVFSVELSSDIPITHLTAFLRPSRLSICENRTRGTRSGFSLHCITSGSCSSGSWTRTLLAFGSFNVWSASRRFTRSCESCVRFMGDFHASKKTKSDLMFIIIDRRSKKMYAIAYYGEFIALTHQVCR